jgi:hypothetical protein
VEERNTSRIYKRAGKAKEKLPVLLETKSVEERVPALRRDQWRRGKVLGLAGELEEKENE